MAQTQYRIEGVVTTRWHDARQDAIDAYNRSRACATLPTVHIPGSVAGDTHESDLSAIHGHRAGHGVVTLRIRESGATTSSAAAA